MTPRHAKVVILHITRYYVNLFKDAELTGKWWTKYDLNQQQQQKMTNYRSHSYSISKATTNFVFLCHV